ncbi:MAG: hypothetical protein FH748_00550 [Balneolaceae bacterium]|nr:hypothetical protein [Balneolaceae bacterium]
MKKEEIDQLITESLNKDEAEFYNALDEENIFKMWGRVYTGKNGWAAIIQSIAIAIFAAVGIYCGYQFFTTSSTHLMFKYGAGMFISMIFASQLKSWVWNQINKIALIREIKRIEFQVAVLMEKLSEK